MNKSYLCSAVGTPLTTDDTLHSEGLRAHLEDQQHAGIDGILAAGTMGAMQLLTNNTYERLVRQCADDWKERELLVGVGDMSFARTMERLQIVNELDVDGVVVLPPFFLSYSQVDLYEYFVSIARNSRAPVFVYDLPQRTGVSLETETVVRLAEHANIAGIKCSGDLARTRRLCDALRGSEFRVIIAQSTMIDVLLRAGFKQHVDGIYCFAPRLVREIADAGARDDWELAAEKTRMFNDFLTVVVKYGVFPAMTTLLNWRGIPGDFAPRPHRPLTPEASERLLAESSVREVFNKF